MYKKGGKRTNWLQRHFTLFNGALCYYASKETKTPKGFILTKDITDCRAASSDKVGKKSGKGQHAFEVITKARTYYFAPDTPELRDQWIAAVKSWIGYSEEDVSTKELPQPGASQRDSKTATAASTSDTAAVAAPAADKNDGDKKAADEAEKKAESARKDDDTDKKAADSDDDKEPAAAAAAETASSGSARDAHKEDEKKEAEKDETEGELQLYEAQYDYDAQEDNELSFKEGDVLTVLDTFKGAGWWKAELHGSIGLVPGNFLTLKKGGKGPF